MTIIMVIIGVMEVFDYGTEWQVLEKYSTALLIVTPQLIDNFWIIANLLL